MNTLVTGNLLRYMRARNYQNRAWFDKVIAKIKGCSFFDSHGSADRPISIKSRTQTDFQTRHNREVDAYRAGAYE